MNKIASEDIKRGMRFSAPVFFDDGKNMFLAKGKSAKAYHIAALERWAIPFVLTSGHEMKGEELSRYLAASKKKEAAALKTPQLNARRSNIAVNMDDIADVTDLFADDGAADDKSDEGNVSDGGIKRLKVEKELDAEDVTSLFM